MLWDIFCKVIDNYGDVGVCWRLAKDLSARGHQVRLWLDDPSPLAWMAPQANVTHPTITVFPWPAADGEAPGLWPSPGDVVIEAFGCELPQGFVHGMAQASSAPVWVNLEYLTAEPYAAKCHRLTSPVMHGAGKGLTKHFFYPGFTADTGGLLRETDLSPPACGRSEAPAWLAPYCAASYPPSVASAPSKRVSLFCYEPPKLTDLLQQLMAQATPCTLLVTSGRARAAVQNLLQNQTFGHQALKSLLSISYLPTLSQTQFDELLWACDVNFVRGEDSLVRALWAGAPLVWQIYPQDDNAHHDKLEAFLDTVHASPVMRAWHQAWNGISSLGLPPLEALWADTTVHAARERLWRQDDLGRQLDNFVRTQRPGNGHSGAKKS